MRVAFRTFMCRAIGKTDTDILRKPFVETRRGAQAWNAQSGIGIKHRAQKWVPVLRKNDATNKELELSAIQFKRTRF